MEYMAEIETDIWGWVETNCLWIEGQKVRAKCQGRKIFKTFKLEAVSSDDPSIGYKQPGGACIGINGNNLGAIVKSGRDETDLGRWVYVCIGGREQRKLYAVVPYRPCKQSSPGNSTVTAEQKRFLIQQGGGEAKSM
eukprot:15362221-Ditylum_brightwellii.AAC.3